MKLAALCNTLHVKNTKYTKCDVDYRRDVSLSVRVCKEGEI